jgi:ZIP family zinc transporter
MNEFLPPNFWPAFWLTLFAGLATGIGSLIAFLSKGTNHRFLSIALGFSAGVMIYVSFVEIFQKARVALVADLGNVEGTWITVLSFFGGMLFIGIIDKFIPSVENPHELKDYQHTNLTHEQQNELKHLKKAKLLRMGVFMALAIGIHNFPEGLATFMAALQDPKLGIAIAVAIAIHNIPEGISVSVPIYYATGSKKKAFFYSFLSGIAEPVGAAIGFFLLQSVMSNALFGIVFAGVAGIMVFISLDELLPAAREYGEHHLSIYGMIAGMMVMALSLLLFI